MRLFLSICALNVLILENSVSIFSGHHQSSQVQVLVLRHIYESTTVNAWLNLQVILAHAYCWNLKQL